MLDLIIDFHRKAKRQGPGGDEQTRKALSFIDDMDTTSEVLDIGCGTGAQTLVLASDTQSNITAVDLLPEFIEELDDKVNEVNLDNRVTTKVASMEALDFGGKQFDLIWSEGAIYHIGFKKGLKNWITHLKPGGYIAVTEISWLSNDMPSEIAEYWNSHYSEIDTISTKINQLESLGLTPVAHFVLPEHCWTENYYKPIKKREKKFLKRHNHSDKAKKLVSMGSTEADLYEQYKDFYSYVFYISRLH